MSDNKPLDYFGKQNQKGASQLILLGIIGLLLLCTYFYLNTSKNKSGVWQSYKDETGSFSFEYPADWTIKKSDPQSFQSDKNGKFYTDPGNKKDIELFGKEGKIEIIWGDSFGGGCGQGYETLNLKNIKVEVCHNVNTQGGEDWVGIQEILNVSDHTGVYINAYANKPSSKNRDIILKILSSIELKQDPEVRVERAVDDYYIGYITCLEDRANNGKADCSQDLGKFINEESIKNIENKGKGFDTFLCAQNIPQGTYVDSKEIKVNGDRAKVKAALDFENPQPNINIDLDLVGEDWKIADISCSF